MDQIDNNIRDENTDTCEGSLSKKAKLDRKVNDNYLSATANTERESVGSFSRDCALFQILHLQEGMHRTYSEQLRMQELGHCIKEGGNVTSLDAKKDTLLHIAVKKGYPEVGRFLLEENAHLRDVRDVNGNSPMHLARILENDNISKILENRCPRDQIHNLNLRHHVDKPQIQISVKDISQSNITRTVTAVPCTTIGDGNCFFHAVFGAQSVSGAYETKYANEMRHEWQTFLRQYESLKDEKMPKELKDQLKKIFYLFLLCPESLSGRSYEIQNVVTKTNDAIKYSDMKVDELKEIIAETFTQDQLFRKEALAIFFSSKDSKLLNKEKDLLENKTKLMNEVSKCLEECTLKLNPALNSTEFKKRYNSETIADAFLEGEEIFENYVRAIGSNKYYVFFEEIPILASLGKVSITILYQDNEKSCATTFEPNKNLLGDFVTDSTVWGQKEKSLIYHQGLHFSHAETLPTEEPRDHSFDEAAFTDEPLIAFRNTQRNWLSNESKKQILNSNNQEKKNLLVPLSTALKEDLDLKYGRKDFKKIILVPEKSNEIPDVHQLDTEVLPSPYVLVELSQKVSRKIENNSDDQYEEQLDLPPGWKLLTTASNKHKTNGYFGAAFWNPKLRQLVIAHQGTKNFGDLCTDFKGVVLDEYASQMNSAVTFADEVISAVHDVIGLPWQLAFTGHSLGGWLAQVTCFSAAFLRKNGKHFIKTDSSGTHAHCVAFDSPGCDAMLRKLKEDFDLRYDGAISPNKLDITTYLSAPNRVNTFNLHFGTLRRIFPDFSNMTVFEKHTYLYTFATHDIDKITETFLERSENERIKKQFKVLDVVDWPLSGFLRRGEEYNTFFKWADHLNNYHPPLCDERLMIDDLTCLRYQTKENDEKCCSLRVFDSNELLFLESWATMNQENIVLFKIAEFTKENNLGNYKDLLPTFTIDKEKTNVHCESKSALETLINRTKNLMRLFGISLTRVIKDQLLEIPSAVESIYMMESKAFLESMIQLDVEFEDRIGLHEFVSSESQQILCVTTDDIDFDLVRTYNICEKLKKQKSDSLSQGIMKYVEHKSIIVLSWQHILSLQSYIDSHSALVTKSKKCDLVIISFHSQAELNIESKVALKALFSGINGEDSKKLIIVTSKDSSFLRYMTLSSSGVNTNVSYKHSDPFNFIDLTSESQNKILDKPLLDIQRTHFKLGEFINVSNNYSGSLHNLQLILGSNLLKNILVAKAPLVKIKDQFIDQYEDVSYAKIDKDIPMENAVQFILHPQSVLKTISKEIALFISVTGQGCSDAYEFAEYLSIFDKERVEKITDTWGSSLIVTAQNENTTSTFKELCREFRHKRIYWLEIRKNFIHFHSVYDHEFYISRKLNDKFHVHTDISEVLLGKMYSDIFIFSNSTKKILTDLFTNPEDGTQLDFKNKVIPLFKEQTACERFEQIKDSGKLVHWIHVEDDTKNLVWVRSSGSMDNIRKYIKRNRDPINEKTFAEKSDKMVLFIGEPGVGKSTTVCSLSKQMKSTWVIHIELRNMHLPANLDLEEIVSFLLKDKIFENDEMAPVLLKQCLTQETALSVLLIFDGFDEIKTKKQTVRNSDSKTKKSHQEQIIKLLEYLKEKTTARIWITSRPFLARTLENNFSIFGTEIQELKNEEQSQFFRNIWTSSLSVGVREFGNREEKLLDLYIERLFAEAKSILGKEISTFMGTPLQMWMIAEVAGPNVELFTNLTNTSDIQSAISLQVNNIYELYQRFIEAKYDIYFQEKSGLSTGLTAANATWLVECLNKKHRHLAFQLLFPDIAEEFLGSKLLRLGEVAVREEEMEINLVGLIQSNLCGEFSFLHPTFAEFFVAELIVSWLNKGEGRHPKYPPLEEFLLNKIFLWPQYKIIRLFLNNHLAVRKLPFNALKHYARRIRSVCSVQNELIFNEDHQTALHVVSKENCVNLVELILKISDRIFLNDTLPEHNEMRFLLTTRDHFGHTAFYLAGQHKHSDVVNKYIQFINNSSESEQKHILLSTLYGGKDDKHDPTISHLLKIIADQGNTKVRELSVEIVKKWELIPDFLQAVQQDNGMKVKQMVHECPDSVWRKYFVAVKDETGMSALHLASESGFEDIVEYLLKQNAPVNVFEETGCTPLHLAAKKGNSNIVRLLHSLGANIFLKDIYNMSTVAWSAREGHLDIVKYLVENGVDPSLADRNGIDPLQHAAKWGHLQVVQWLVERGVDIDRVDHFGKTALAWAARAGYLDMVKYLVSRGANARRPDRHGLCAAQVAANSHKWDVAKWLLAHGAAEPGDILKRAICSNQWRVVEEVLVLTPLGGATGWLTPGGKWVTQILKAGKLELLARVVSKGAEPGDEVRGMLGEVEEHQLTKNERKMENKEKTMKNNSVVTNKEMPRQTKSNQQNSGGQKVTVLSAEEEQKSLSNEEKRNEIKKVEMSVVISEKEKESMPLGDRDDDYQERSERKYDDKDGNTEWGESKIRTGGRGKMGCGGTEDNGPRYSENRKTGKNNDCETDNAGRTQWKEINYSSSEKHRGEGGNGSTKCKEDIWREEDNQETGRIEENDQKLSIKTKIERVLQLGSASHLDSFLHSLPHENHIVFEAVLAELNQDLAAKRVPILPQMQEAMETKLIQLRLFSEPNHTAKAKKEELSLDDVKCCVEMIEEAVTKMNLQCSTEASDEVDGAFLHNALSVARYMHVLKRFLRPTFTLLPWNEMEFCLIRFLTSILKPQETDEIERLILDKAAILNHLANFADKLKEVNGNLGMKDLKPKHKLSARSKLVKNIISQKPEFKALFDDYDKLRNIYSLKKIVSSIELALSVDLKQNRELGIITIERTLQVLGECLKNTPDSPNVSDDVHNLLLESAPRQAKDIVLSLRDTLSHADSLTRKVELESKKNPHFFEIVQNDLKKMGTETITILFREKVNAFIGFLKKIVEGNSCDETKELIARFQNCGFETEEYFSFRSKELEKFKMILGELKLEYGEELTPERDALFKKINDIVDAEVSRIINAQKMYAEGLRTFNFYFRIPSKNSSHKKFAQRILDELENKESRLKEIIPLLKNFTGHRTEEEAFMVSWKVYKLFSMVDFEIGRIQGINDIRFHLTDDVDDEETYIGKRIMNIFTIIEGKLKSEESKKAFAEVTKDQIKIHESKMKLKTYFANKLLPTKHEEVGEINCTQLFGDLKFEGGKQEDLRRNYEAGNFEECQSLVKMVNDNYNNLIKSIGEISTFSVEKISIALKTFFSFHKKLKSQINNAIDEIEKENRIEIAKFYNERISLLQGILDSGKSDKETEMAVEMLLLEATEVLEHSSLLADNKLFLLEDSPVLVGKAFRNYLAHGDPLVDIMPFSPRTAIFAHARALVAQGGDLITKRRVLGRPSKHMDLLEICKRDEQRERMVAVQEGMFQAAKRGDLAAVRDWVSNGADPQGRSINGRSALDFAIMSDDINTFQFFLGYNVDFDIRQTVEVAVSNGSIQIVEHLCDIYSLNLNCAYFREAKLLQRASEKGKKTVLEYLLSRRSDREICSDYELALRNAVKKGHRDILEVLLRFTEKSLPGRLIDDLLLGALFEGHSDIVRVVLDHGADPDVKIDDHFTPLCIAAFFGMDDVVLELLAQGASVNGVNINGKTPLQVALMQGHEDIAMVLLHHGAEVGYTDRLGISPLHDAAKSGAEKAVQFILESGVSVNSLMIYSKTPLHCAAENGHVGTVCVLLDRDADVHVREVQNGRTALHMAAQNGAVDVVREIVKRHPDAVNVGDTKENSPLHLAAESGHVDVALELIRAGADLSARDVEQRTPLHAAARFGKEEVAAALLEAGAEVDPLDIYKFTPLHGSVINNNPAVSKLLIAKGAQILAKSMHEISMLTFAARMGCLDSVRVLIESGADVNSSGHEFAACPLHAAVHIGRKDIVLALLDKGASIYTQDIDGRTLLFRAAEKGHNELAELLASRWPAAVHIPTKRFQTPLWIAAAEGFGDVVATLLRHGAEVNAVNRLDGPSVSALEAASLNGHRDVVEQLLRRGALVNSPKENEDSYGSALHAAAENDHRQVVSTLLDFGADVNGTRNGLTALFNASVLGYEDLAILLVERGANVDARGTSGATPLHIAAENGLVRLAHTLLSHGADAWDTGPGRSPLQVATAAGDADVVLALLDHGATDCARVAAVQDVLEEAVGRGKAAVVAALLEVPGVTVGSGAYPGGLTELHQAAGLGHADVTEVLLNHGANIEARTYDDMTALHVAAHEGHVDVVATLLRHGASPNACIRKQNHPGASSLHLAIKERHTHVVRVLLEHGAVVNATDASLVTPLHLAKCKEAAQVLLDHKAFPNAQDIEGKTPLHRACMGGLTDVVAILLAKGANANTKDFEKRAPLHLASQLGHTDIILQLLDMKVELEPRDIYEMTPLHFAAFHGQPGATELLAAHGASVDAREVDGATPLLLTSAGGAKPEMKAATALALLAAGANPNLANSDGRSPLKSAVLKGQAALVSVLLQGGADANVTDANGETLFQMALTMSGLSNSDADRETYELIAGFLLGESK